MTTTDDRMPRQLKRKLESVTTREWHEADAGKTRRMLRLARALLRWVDGSEDRLQRAFASLPGAACDWLLDLPELLVNRGLVDEARRLAYSAAEVWSPEDFYADLALALAHAGHADLARQEMQNALERFPADPWVWIKCGDAALALEDDAEAERRYRKAIALAADDDGTRDAAEERLEDMSAGALGRGGSDFRVEGAQVTLPAAGAMDGRSLLGP